MLLIDLLTMSDSNGSLQKLTVWHSFNIFILFLVASIRLKNVLERVISYYYSKILVCKK